MKTFVAVTDQDWYDYLRARPDLDEVNFWQPGGAQEFKALDRGEPFLFKLKFPNNYIVGGGFLAHFSFLPASLAWAAFGEKNGAPSFRDMRKRIERLRHSAPSPHEDYTIGCVILHDPFFLDRPNWIPAPPDFHPNIVRGKSYDLAAASGNALWEQVLGRRAIQEHALADSQKPMYGDPALVRPRLGQGAFRVLVTDLYERRCAVTREKALPVLDAAHIKPVSEGGIHDLVNGLLLRSDVHTLFDLGYVTITPEYRVRVSRKLKEDFDNGEHYYGFEGAAIWLPKSAVLRPAQDLLRWHADAVFRG